MFHLHTNPLYLVVEKVVYPMNKVLPFLLLLFVFTSCSRKYKI